MKKIITAACIAAGISASCFGITVLRCSRDIYTDGSIEFPGDPPQEVFSEMYELTPVTGGFELRRFGMARNRQRIMTVLAGTLIQTSEGVFSSPTSSVNVNRDQNSLHYRIPGRARTIICSGFELY